MRAALAPSGARPAIRTWPGARSSVESVMRYADPSAICSGVEQVALSGAPVESSRNRQVRSPGTTNQEAPASSTTASDARAASSLKSVWLICSAVADDGCPILEDSPACSDELQPQQMFIRP